MLQLLRNDYVVLIILLSPPFLCSFKTKLIDNFESYLKELQNCVQTSHQSNHTDYTNSKQNKKKKNKKKEKKIKEK